jgi:AcrR family transcriptional regulator
VLEEAFAAFAAHGAAVSIREIARRAGVSTDTVTRHFPTKEALFRAVALHRIEHLVHSAEEIVAREHPATAVRSVNGHPRLQRGPGGSTHPSAAGRSGPRRRRQRRRQALIAGCIARDDDGTRLRISVGGAPA